MLKQLTESGSVFSIRTLNGDLKTLYKRTLGKEFDVTRVYIRSVVKSQGGLSLSTHFSNPWPAELDPIFNETKDETQAAFMLCAMLMQDLIDSPDSWWCTKTDVTGRDLATNFYWRKI